MKANLIFVFKSKVRAAWLDYFPKNMRSKRKIEFRISQFNHAWDTRNFECKLAILSPYFSGYVCVALRPLPPDLNRSKLQKPIYYANFVSFGADCKYIQIKWGSYTIQVPSALLRLDVTFNAALFLINFDRFCLLSLRCSWGIHGLRLKLNRPKLEIVDARTHWATSAVPQTLEGLSVGAPQAPIQLGGARSRAEWGFGFNLVERKFIQDRNNIQFTSIYVWEQ